MISPLLSNVYLNEVDKMLERAKSVTRYRQLTLVEYARFADDMVVLVNAHPKQRWLREAVEQRLREVRASVFWALSSGVCAVIWDAGCHCIGPR